MTLLGLAMNLALGLLLALGGLRYVRRRLAGREQLQTTQQALQALHAQLYRLQAILQHSPLCLFLKDARTWQYLYTNPAYTRLWGLEPEAMLHRTDFELFPSDVAEMLRAHDLAVVRANQAAHQEETYPSRGSARVFLCTRYPIVNGGPLPYALAGAAVEITERVQHEQQAHQDLDELQQQVQRLVKQEYIRDDWRRTRNDLLIDETLTHLQRIAIDGSVG